MIIDEVYGLEILDLFGSKMDAVGEAKGQLVFYGGTGGSTDYTSPLATCTLSDTAFSPATVPSVTPAVLTAGPIIGETSTAAGATHVAILRTAALTPLAMLTVSLTGSPTGDIKLNQTTFEAGGTLNMSSLKIELVTYDYAQYF